MASMRFKKVFLGPYSTISSNIEKISTTFNSEDFFNGEKTCEDGEVSMQMKVLNDIISKNDIDLVIGGDLSNQIGITSMVMSEKEFPFLGIYSACASYVEALILASALVSMPAYKNIACITSGNNLVTERTFKYPIEYGSPRRFTQSFTATGAVAGIVTKKETNVIVESATIGKVVDYEINDVNNMGAIMAPAAADTLIKHLRDMKRDISYYDLVLTGDLGELGSELFKELLAKHDITIKNYIDAGNILIKDKTKTDIGASGPICLPLILYEKILKSKKYKTILIIGTGSLHNITMTNQHKNIPAISHAVSLEVCE